MEVSMSCVYKEYDVKIKLSQEQWLLLKWNFYWVIAWQLLFHSLQLLIGENEPFVEGGKIMVTVETTRGDF